MKKNRILVVAVALLLAGLAAWAVPWWRNRPFRAQSPGELAAVKNPHAAPLACPVCHTVGDESVPQPNAVCLPCHKAHADHPIGKRQKQPVDKRLPLGPDGLLVCHTCHEPHDMTGHKYGLRLAYAPLCQSCHQGY